MRLFHTICISLLACAPLAAAAEPAYPVPLAALYSKTSAYPYSNSTPAPVAPLSLSYPAVETTQAPTTRNSPEAASATADSYQIANTTVSDETRRPLQAAAPEELDAAMVALRQDAPVAPRLAAASPSQPPLPTAITPQLARASDSTPDLISFGLGYYDMLRDPPVKQTWDFRGEYRWGLSMLDQVDSWLGTDLFSGWSRWFQVHPSLGLEATGEGAMYGLFSFANDIRLHKNIALTWSEGVGFYERGDGKRLGSFIEFRSMLEAGYIDDSGWRLTAQVSHISNAGLTKKNPGSNIVGGYLHLPADWF